MRTTENLFASSALALALGMTCLAGGASEGRGENLLAFVCQKISLTQQAPPRCDNCILMDAYYVAGYRVLETVFGEYRGGAIRFDVYDHYGAPAFSAYDTVLLFVSRQPDGSWKHEKYLFHPLHKGADGQWYGCGDPYAGTAHPHRTVQARPVQFAAPVSFPLDELSPNKIKRLYPAGYFEIRDGRAVCLLGTPVAELFEAKKQTVLTARGIFKPAEARH